MRSLPELDGSGRMEPCVDRADKLDSFLAAQWRELQEPQAVGGNDVGKCDPGPPRTGRGEDCKALPRLACSAYQVAAEGERELVHPVKVVDDEQRRLEGSKRAVRGLEHAYRLKRGSLVRLEEEGLELGSEVGHLGQGSQQTACGRKGNVALGLIPCDCE
jgi:hypothetical protein